MTSLKEVLGQQIPAARTRVKDLLKQHENTEIENVKVGQIFGGMRGISCLICDTSSVPPDKGLIIRGYPVAELAYRLPEEILWLLLTGTLPNKDQIENLRADLARRAAVPDYVWNVLDAMPANAHPMTLFSAGVLCLQGESVFKDRYEKGLRKEDFWDPTLEDALNIIARVPVIAAGIYRKKFNKGPRIAPDASLDWGTNYARMLGINDPKGEFAKLIRMYLVLHCDHENGNVSAMATYTVNSALSDLYYSFSAGLDGLAGPLHGLANQECLMWVLNLMKQFNGAPSKEQVANFAKETLAAGKVIPGYGHGVLRVTDPRFTCFHDFGQKHCPEDPVFKTVATVFDVLPDILKTINKIKDPWPNVDAASGSLLYHYGLTEAVYYTVLFGVSRALGVCSQAVLARALAMPISRPKSVTTDWIEKRVACGISGRQVPPAP